MSLLEPDRYFSKITDIDIEQDLLCAGLDCVLLDIDNTIRSRETGDVPRDVGVWLGKARDAGIRFCLLSNNWHASVADFAKRYDLPIVAKAMKPLPFAYAAARKRIAAPKKSTVAIGDQLLTDVAGAHIAGIKAFLVLPLAEKDLRHTLVLRNLEHALLGSRKPEHAHGHAIVENSGKPAI